ncbi:MAG: extracellular solute-binding protein [Eubacteriales bacterium]|nr:extracellular solute-binding protein [Eubacteriales bacterium]
MKRKLRCLLAGVLTGSLCLSGCGQANPQAEQGDVTVIKFPTFQVGVNPSAPAIEQITQRFNEKFEGKYRIEIEEVPGDANYVEKMKVLLSADSLPAVIDGRGYNLLDMALSRDAVVDLTPYLEADPEWKAQFDERTLEYNSRDGKVYSIPAERSVIGYFYNKELFAKAGITKTAETWEELFAQFEQLKAAGITPLSMDTADSAWSSSLWLGAFMATAGPEAQQFMDQMMPSDYNDPAFVEGARRLNEMLQNYTTDDAIGGKFEHAANNFLSGKTAIIANGPWMTGSFSDPTKAPEGFADKVGVAIYPESCVYSAPMLGYFVAAKEEKQIEAAVEMVKFFTSDEAQQIALEVSGLLPASQTVEITDDIRTKYPLTAELLDLAKGAEIQVNYLQATMYPNLLDVMSQELPSLVAGQIDAAEFCDRLTQAALKNQ